ncbi:hypothetical protein BDR04DRAFT_1128492 [Suillus decipiens]|nr:hypothetical protein BDR04DRAFT_1128492 [Suillus decipiens]
MWSISAKSDKIPPPEQHIPVASKSEFRDDNFEEGFAEGFANFEPFNIENKPQQPNIVTHPHLRGDPCNANGISIPAGSPPSPRFSEAHNNWTPFTDQAQFLLADFLFQKVEMLGPNIDFLMELCPFKSHHDMYTTIDTIGAGDVPWQCFTVSPQEELSFDAPSWKQHEYQVWYCDPDTVIKNMLNNPDFDGKFDYTPYIQYDKDRQHQWKNFISGNYTWCKSDEIHGEDNSCDGAMYCGVILGSNKMTMSVATGHVEYHPLYLFIRNPHNSIHHAHQNAIMPIGFLAIPKSQLLQHGMTTPVVQHCPDGHYHRVIYDLSAFIADYPEQVMLADIVQNWCAKPIETLPSTELWDQYGINDDIVPFTNDFPYADIHEMLSPDLLHQVIKGCFKDHLVKWTCEYLSETYGEAQANEILDNIDRQIAAAPLFPGLRCFPHGCHFKKWTGDDLKALMKVYIPAIIDYVPAQLVQCMSAFLDFCYLVWHSKIVHYLQLIQEFRAPNGLCSSITEFRHITATKCPWCCLSRFERLDKLAAAQAQLVAHGMLPAPYSPPLKLLDEVEHNLDVTDIAKVESFVFNLELLTHQFLFNQLHIADDLIALDAVEEDLPDIRSNISVFHSATATFSAPSNISGMHGMHHEIIWSMPLWDDCWQGQIVLFLPPARLSHRFSCMGQGPDTITGMWRIKPEVMVTGRQQTHIQSIEHIDTIYQAANLLPAFSDGPLPVDFHFSHSLDAFNSYFVNKYADHHANEIMF